MADFDIAAVGEIGHLLGEFGEASNTVRLRRATQGNDIAFVHDHKDMPSSDKMERNVLYVHRNEKGDLCASALKETYLTALPGIKPKPKTINLTEAFNSLANPDKRSGEQRREDIECLKRIEKYVDDRQATNFSKLNETKKEQYAKDVDKLFKSSASVISKTNREKILNIAGNAGAAMVAAANCAIVPILGDKSAISAFKDTDVGRAVDKLQENFASSKNQLVKAVNYAAKGWNYVANNTTREVAASCTVAVNTAISAVFGSKNSLSLFRDSTVRNWINNPESSLNKNLDQYVKQPFKAMQEKSPALKKVVEGINYGVEKIHEFTNSKAVSHSLTIGFGVVSGLALGMGVAGTWPVSVPGIVLGGSVGIYLGAKAEQRRSSIKAEKTHLSNLVRGIGKKERLLDELGISKDQMYMLSIKPRATLRDIEQPKITTFRATHSYAEKEVGKLLVQNSALIAAKSFEAVSNPLGVGMEGAALTVASASAVSIKLQEHQALSYLQKELSLLRSMLPEEELKKSPQEMARRSREAAIEADTLEKASKDAQFKEYMKAAKGKEMDSLEVTKLRTRFAHLREEASKEFLANPENARDYNAYRTEDPEKGVKGSIKNLARSMQDFGGYTFKYLFKEKSTYKESLGISDELKEIVVRCSPEERNAALRVSKTQDVIQQPEKSKEKEVLHQVTREGLKAKQDVARRASFAVRAANMLGMKRERGLE